MHTRIALGSMALMASTLAAAQTPPAPVESVLRDYTRDCDAVGRGLWNMSLCAPIVVVGPGGTIVLTSEPRPAAPLPATRANTSVDWGGRKWVMVLAPLPQDAADLRALVYHEAFHVHQAEIGLPNNMAVASHLDSEDARYWMRLEWKALEFALNTGGDERTHHTEQALAFRKQRLALAPDAAKEERLQMRHEGLAEYTGVKLSTDPLWLTQKALLHGAERPSFSRSFAYVSGPAWGMLLDMLEPEWRSKLRSKPDADLPDLVPRRKPAKELDTVAYGGDAIRSEEHARAMKRVAVLDAATTQTSETKGLRLPLARIQLDFDPNRVYPMPDGSSVYDKITLTSDWGSLQSEGAPVRIEQDWKAVFVPWPTPRGMTLKLASGWSATPDASGRMRVAQVTPTP